MVITYFIILIIALIFKLFHWPGTSFLFLISPIFLFVEVIRSSIKENNEKLVSIFAAIAMFFSSVFILFRFLYWPGWHYLFVITLFINAGFIFLLVKNKIVFTAKYVFTSLLLVFSIVNFSLKSSDFRLLYLLEDPFNPSEIIPHFEIQKIAYDFYQEGEYKKSTFLIKRNIHHLNDLVSQLDVSDEEHKIDIENLSISQHDLEAIKKQNWNEFKPLIHIDRTIE